MQRAFLFQSPPRVKRHFGGATNKLRLCDPSVGNVMNPARSVDCAQRFGPAGGGFRIGRVERVPQPGALDVEQRERVGRTIVKLFFDESSLLRMTDPRSRRT